MAVGMAQSLLQDCTMGGVVVREQRYNFANHVIQGLVGEFG